MSGNDKTHEYYGEDARVVFADCVQIAKVLCNLRVNTFTYNICINCRLIFPPSKYETFLSEIKSGMKNYIYKSEILLACS